MSALASHLQAHAARINLAVVAELYRNPFWQARFGERGRRYAEQDGAHHVSYLAQALSSGQPAVLVAYARWLQGVLTTRGMCSRHLAENFARLGEAVAREGLPGVEQARDYLRQAEQALVYREGPAREVQLAASAVAVRAAAALYAAHPDWSPAGRDRCVDDLRYHLDYLADALALRGPATFVAYLEWVDGFLVGRGVPAGHLRQALAALDAALGDLPPEARDPARAFLAEGRAALERRG